MGSIGERSVCELLEPHSFDWWFYGCWVFGMPFKALTIAAAFVAAWLAVYLIARIRTAWELRSL